MRTIVRWSGLTVAVVAGLLVAMALPGFAQEGHPLSGTWSGDWGTEGGERNHLTVVMSWDGSAVNGLINPGPNSMELTSVRVNPADWTVRIEASGSGGEIAADGRIDDLGSAHRTISGTWRQGGATGDFQLTRD